MSDTCLIYEPVSKCSFLFRLKGVENYISSSLEDNLFLFQEHVEFQFPFSKTVNFNDK